MRFSVAIVIIKHCHRLAICLGNRQSVCRQQLLRNGQLLLRKSALVPLHIDHALSDEGQSATTDRGP